jgi:hypothetical protein
MLNLERFTSPSVHVLHRCLAIDVAIRLSSTSLVCRMQCRRFWDCLIVFPQLSMALKNFGILFIVINIAKLICSINEESKLFEAIRVDDAPFNNRPVVVICYDEGICFRFSSMHQLIFNGILIAV